MSSPGTRRGHARAYGPTSHGRRGLRHVPSGRLGRSLSCSLMAHGLAAAVFVIVADAPLGRWQRDSVVIPVFAVSEGASPARPAADRPGKKKGAVPRAPAAPRPAPSPARAAALPAAGSSQPRAPAATPASPPAPPAQSPIAADAQPAWPELARGAQSASLAPPANVAPRPEPAPAPAAASARALVDAAQVAAPGAGAALMESASPREAAPAQVLQGPAPALVAAPSLALAAPLPDAPPRESAETPRATPVPVAALPEQDAVALPPVPAPKEAEGAADLPVEPVAPAVAVTTTRRSPESVPAAPRPPAPRVDDRPASPPVLAESSTGVEPDRSPAQRPEAQPPPARALAMASPAVSPPPQRVDPAGSPIGLGLERRVRVEFDGSRTRSTSEPALAVSGRLLGAAPQDFVLRVNGAGHATQVDGRAFQATVGLQPGPNRITAVVVGPDGQEGEDTITVDYTPRPAPKAIALTSPGNGTVLGPDDPPAIVVEGNVDDPTVTAVTVIANGHELTTPVRQGRFRQVVPVLEPLVHLWAQSLANGTVHRSETTSVTRSASGGPTGMILMQWAAGPAAAPVEVSAVWRSTPGRLDVPAVPVTLRSLGPGNGALAADGYYLRNLRPGAYTFTLRAGGGEARPVLYYADGSLVVRRPLRAVAMDRPGPVVLARVLLPYGVFWEDDAWFTGKSESADTIVKFRVPEGITWAERKADLR